MTDEDRATVAGCAVVLALTFMAMVLMWLMGQI